LPSSFGDQIDKNGWRAGAVLPASLVSLLNPYLARPNIPVPEIASGHWFVVISQTCDVVQLKQENEPLVEILHCTPVAQLRAEFQGRKSTRRLDFRPNKETHPDVILTAHAVTGRYVIPRALLLDYEPDPQRYLSESSVNNIQQWYALRYTRPPWPDAFNDRIDQKTKKKLAKALKLLTTDDVEVRVAIAEKDCELALDKSYHITVFFVVDQLVWDASPEVRDEAHAAFSAFVSALSACDGIETNKEFSEVTSGEKFSWQLTRTTDEWNFANLSSHD
jgi:hypothetical protein